LVVGRLLPTYFPKIFGPNEDQPLDSVAVHAEFEALAVEINKAMEADGRPALSVDQVAYG
jgi:5-oxoprolinase (ATP-hydrolysing)